MNRQDAKDAKIGQRQEALETLPNGTVFGTEIKRSKTVKTVGRAGKAHRFQIFQISNSRSQIEIPEIEGVIKTVMNRQDAKDAKSGQDELLERPFSGMKQTVENGENGEIDNVTDLKSQIEIPEVVAPSFSPFSSVRERQRLQSPILASLASWRFSPVCGSLPSAAFLPSGGCSPVWRFLDVSSPSPLGGAAPQTLPNFRLGAHI